jgi:hypothetical protein
MEKSQSSISSLRSAFSGTSGVSQKEQNQSWYDETDGVDLKYRVIAFYYYCHKIVFPLWFYRTLWIIEYVQILSFGTPKFLSSWGVLDTHFLQYLTYLRTFTTDISGRAYLYQATFAFYVPLVLSLILAIYWVRHGYEHKSKAMMIFHFFYYILTSLAIMPMLRYATAIDNLSDINSSFNVFLLCDLLKQPPTYPFFDNEPCNEGAGLRTMIGFSIALLLMIFTFMWFSTGYVIIKEIYSSVNRTFNHVPGRNIFSKTTCFHSVLFAVTRLSLGILVDQLEVYYNPENRVRTVLVYGVFLLSFHIALLYYHFIYLPYYNLRTSLASIMMWGGSVAFFASRIVSKIVSNGDGNPLLSLTFVILLPLILIPLFFAARKRIIRLTSPLLLVDVASENVFSFKRDYEVEFAVRHAYLSKDESVLDKAHMILLKGLEDFPRSRRILQARCHLLLCTDNPDDLFLLKTVLTKVIRFSYFPLDLTF